MMRTYWPVLLGMLVLTGCATARKRSDVPLVRRVEFRGNRGGPLGDRSDQNLRDAMAQRSSPPFLMTWPLSLAADGIPYTPDLLPGDQQRIETYLAHHGYFDATVTWRTKRKRADQPKRAGVVDLVGDVILGPTTRWTDRPRFEGALPPEVTPAAIQGQTMIRGGRRFRLDDVDATEAAVLRLLRDRGYAHARLTLDLEVRPDLREAEVTWLVDPGPRIRVSEVTLEGDALDRDDIALDQTNVRAGQWWNATRLDQGVDALYGTGAFDLAVAAPPEGRASEQDEQSKATFRVHEGRPRQFQLGAELGLQGRFITPAVRGTWSSARLGRGLTRIDLGTRLGFGATATQFVPIAEIWIRRTQPRLGIRGLSWQIGADARNDIFELITSRTDVRALTRLELRPWAGPVTFAVEPQIRWTRMGLAQDEGQEAAIVAALGPQFAFLEGEDRPANQYAMAELAGEVRLGQLTPVGRRTRGATATLGAAALSRVDAPGSYQRLNLDLRGYVAPRGSFLGKPVQLIGRFSTTRLLNVDQTLPYPEQLFLGGASDFRGFRSGHVGPYDCVCVPRPFQGVWALASDPVIAAEGEIRRHYLPRGGQTSALLGGELQFDRVLLPDLTVVAFGEVGALTQMPADVLDQLRFAVGAGIRYATSLGPLRLDVALRPIYSDDEGPVTTVSCEGYAFRRRAFDMVSEFGRFRPLDRRFPAINVFLTLGEAL